MSHALTRSPRRLGSLGLAALLSVLVVAPPRTSSADVVRLRTGEAVKGRVLADQTNEQILVMEDYLTGRRREIAWAAVADEDADRIQRDKGMKFVAMVLMADQITYRLNNGTTATVRGKVTGEKDGFLILRNRTSSDIKIAKNVVVSRETIEVDPQEVYSPTELAAEEKAKRDPQDARGWYGYGQFCESVEAYPEAKEAYENAAADSTFLSRKQAQDAALRVASIIQDVEAMKTVLDLRTAMGAQLWKRVREGIEGFAAKHPEAGEAVKKKLESLKADFDARRAKAFQEMAGKRFEPILKDILRKKIANKELAYNEVQGWIRNEFPKEATERLLKEFQAKDPVVTEDELKAFWENRPKRASGWKLAKYGSGSFIVEPPKVLPKTGNRAPAQPRSGNQGPAVNIELPKPPTRDGWWKDASTEERADFWFALFVEKSQLFEVDPKKPRVDCVRCEGDGTLTFTMGNGGAATVLCPRCGGARFDYSVKYR